MSPKRKEVKQGSEGISAPLLEERVVYSNLESTKRKLPIVSIKIEEKQCSVLLDSASTASIISKDVLVNYLNKEENEIQGPRGCIKGITGSRISDLGKINLKIAIMGCTFEENFLVLEESFFPAQVLFSIETMEKCGIKIDFADRIMKIKGREEEEGVSFYLEEESILVNQANLLETASSEGRNASGDKVSKNQSRQENNKNSSSSVIKDENLQEKATNAATLNNKFEHAPTENINHEVYLASKSEETKPISEVMLLKTIKKHSLMNHLDEEINVEQENLVYFSEFDEDELCYAVSTNDDCKIPFRIRRQVVIPPNSISKLPLIANDDQWRIDNKEVILTSDSILPEGISMDNNLVKLNGTTCETFVHNHTDKRLLFRPGQTFCFGIFLDHQTLSVNGDTFFSFASVEDENLNKEINQIHFPEKRTDLINLLKEFREVVATTGDKLGRTNVIQHKILLEEGAKPFFIPNYKLPISQRQIVEDLIKDMKAEGIVRPSNSPYNSPLLLVPKKDGSWRMVIDFRKLNKQTVPDYYPMPVINDVLAQLGGAKVFSSLDLLSGYWQVPLDEESKPLTAFSSHSEHLEFQVMPFGLTSAPLTFMRLMMSVLGEIKNVFVYLDDVIIFSKDVDSHLETLRIVLERFKEAGLKIKAKKCQFLMKELDYLGHTLNEEGVKMQAGKIKSILEYPPPKNVKAVRRFLGMIGYYRPFIQNFATKATPLTELLKNDNTFKWREQEQRAFEILKDCLIKEPVLVYPDFSKEFYLACDASSTGLGAVLMQKGKGRMRVVSYGSRVMNETERRYSTTERECLALFWGLRKYRHIILGYRVNILTDHKPLLDLFKKREFINNQKFNRWFLAILEYGPEIKYIPGKCNTLADGLSRAFEDEEKEKFTNKFCFTCQEIDLDMEIVKEGQEKDPDLRNIIADLINDEKLRPDFQLINGILYKKPRKKEECARLYVPKTLVKEVLKLTHCHRLAGHPGIRKTTRIITRNYFWPRCGEEAKEFVQQCHVCNQHKGNVNRPAPLEKYPTELYPFQMVTMDFLGPFPVTPKGNKHILVFIDYMTRYVEIVPVKDRMAETVAEAFKSRIITRHSCPEVLLSDNAAEFTSEILKKLCEFYEIKKVEITAYKPSSNGAVERMNKKIKDVLRTMITPSTVNWDVALEDVQLVINNSVNETLGETPHFLLYGYQKRLPLSLLDDAKPPRILYNYEDVIALRVKTYYDTVKKVRKMLEKGYETNKKYYKSEEKKNIRIGKKVYVIKNIPEGPNIKVSPKFEGPYRVLEIMKLNKYKLVHEHTHKEIIAHYNTLKLVKNDCWNIFQKENGSEESNGSAHTNADSSPYNLRSRS